MGSSTVRAQQLANESNIAMQHETNQWNYDIAHEANLWNWSNMQAQNEWNIQQWERENAYNDPQAQMERIIKAGINPIFAAGGVDAGNAAHLESAQAHPAAVPEMGAPHVNPEYDPYIAQHVGNIVAASRDLMNNFQGWYDLGLKEQDVQTRRAGQISRSGLDRASAAEKHAATAGREIENAWNMQTFDLRAHEEAQKLQNLEAQFNNMQAGTEESQARKLEIEERKKLVSEQINQVIASIRQQDRALDIASRNAAVSEGNLEVARQSFTLADEKFSAQIKQWNNENLLRYMEKFSTEYSGSAGAKAKVAGVGVEGEAGVKTREPADLLRARYCGIEILQRAADNPTPENLEQAGMAAKFLDAYHAEQMFQMFQRSFNNNLPPDTPSWDFNTSNTSVLNP